LVGEGKSGFPPAGPVPPASEIRRRSEVLTEAFDMGECDPIKIEEYTTTSQTRRPST